ncbi:MAG: guanylate kinase [Clostridiales bacterium]|nr:guanylate kinase [Clostridiales bacterium]
MGNKGLLIVLSGPSGTGKGTICSAYLKRNPGAILSVSVTTRKPRPGEKEGVNYYYTDKKSFEKMVDENRFLEYAQVYGNYYGTPRDFVEKKIASGYDVILEIDIQGALQVKEKFPEGVFVFIIPPSMDELKRRIVKRGTESAEAIYTRFQSAYQELNYMAQYNYVVVNDTVDEAVRKLEAIVLAEKCRVARNKGLYLGQ